MVRWDITATDNMNKTNLFKALLLALIGGTIAFTACSPTNTPISNDKPIEEPHHNEELFFNDMDIKYIDLDTIRKYAISIYVDTIFMIPNDINGVGGAVSGKETKGITRFRDFMQKRFDVSRKVRGKGDLVFEQGAALPADSLWFVEQGWTVNEYWKTR